ncbi:hypothetical protein AMTR_s00014p00249090 [Amborella trichopoda]|uniref:Uncharacterized protein n=1 Tax=Amborella trichopoda TaxID=13333 RepID=W1PPU7_AMBTC|nr:hypothetical protein AMTR_s00014p00249090 [Amborella trichopoda]
MYPLMHCRAARRIRSSLRPSFDPLAIDHLAIVLIDEGEEQNLLEEGEFALEALEVLGADGYAPEVDRPDLGLAVVEMDDLPPLNVTLQENKPLVLHLVADILVNLPVQVYSKKEVQMT